MSVILEFTVDNEAFEFGRLLAVSPEMHAGFVEYDAESRTVQFRDCPHWADLSDDHAAREDIA